MFLIHSTYYQDFLPEIGKIPIAFLPLGGKRLYELQVFEVLKLKLSNIYISLPKSFRIPNWDMHILNDLNVKILYVDDDLNISESIISCLNQIPNLQAINILGGDSLVMNLNEAIGDKYDINLTDDEVFLGFNLNEYISINSTKEFIQQLSNDKTLYNTLKVHGKKIKFTQFKTAKIYSFTNKTLYFSSKIIAKTQRAFNEIEFQDKVVEKRSDNHLKMSAEANWYNTLPNNLKTYTPNFIKYIEDEKSQTVGYSIEYLSYLSLNEIYVFGNTPNMIWDKILNKCFEFLTTLSINNSVEIVINSHNMYYKKIIDRLKTFSKVRKFDLNQSLYYNDQPVGTLLEINDELYEAISNNISKISLIHGDFCFSNILYDFKQNIIKVIDPRGLDHNNKQSIYGDIRYDISKLYHSIIGRYDHIIANRYKLTLKDNNYDLDFGKTNTAHVTRTFKSLLKANFSCYSNTILPITIGLFLSMLPLHFDCEARQNAFLANALRLFLKFKKANQ